LVDSAGVDPRSPAADTQTATMRSMQVAQSWAAVGRGILALSPWTVGWVDLTNGCDPMPGSVEQELAAVLKLASGTG